MAQINQTLPGKTTCRRTKTKSPDPKTQNQSTGAPSLKESELSHLKTTDGGQDLLKKPKNKIQNQTLTHTIRDGDQRPAKAITILGAKIGALAAKDQEKNQGKRGGRPKTREKRKKSKGKCKKEEAEEEKDEGGTMGEVGKARILTNQAKRREAEKFEENPRLF